MNREIIKILSSPKLFVYCLVWLMVLVVVGTVSQRDIGLFASQQRYFSSYIFLFGPIPLPGGRIVLGWAALAAWRSNIALYSFS